MRHIPILTSIAELAATSDAWIVDIWGVMHNGERAYQAAARGISALDEMLDTIISRMGRVGN